MLLCQIKDRNQISQRSVSRLGNEQRLARIKLPPEAVDPTHDENGYLARQVFELSQALRSKWFTADRGILEVVCLNCEHVNVSLYVTVHKPLDTQQFIDNIKKSG